VDGDVDPNLHLRDWADRQVEVIIDRPIAQRVLLRSGVRDGQA